MSLFELHGIPYNLSIYLNQQLGGNIIISNTLIGAQPYQLFPNDQLLLLKEYKKLVAYLHNIFQTHSWIFPPNYTL